MVDTDEIEHGRTHLFISYAIEDSNFVDWLSLKLTAEGYAIWCDRCKLLGGERFPQSIDDALTNRTFRMLAVLSKASIGKDNPVAERTLGFSIGKERKIDFVIPINLDKLKPVELGFQSSSITYISFGDGWAPGLKQLLNKLDSIDCPKSLINGKRVAAAAIAENDVILPGEENLVTNILPVVRFPNEVKCFAITTPNTESGMESLEGRWAFYYLNNKEVLSFSDPSPSILSDYALVKKEVLSLDRKTIRNTPTKYVIQNLIFKSIILKCKEKGLLPVWPKEGAFYFPYKEKDWLRFIDFNGEERRRLASGARRARSAMGITPYHWHLAPKFKVKNRGGDDYYLLINIGAYVTDVSGNPYNKRLRNARVKKVALGWWNNRILEYQIAVSQLLSDGGDRIIIGEDPSEQVIISGRFTRVNFFAKINDATSKNEAVPDIEDDLSDLIEDNLDEDEGV